eukprot:scaffold14549_cov228-Alexandrium_tamarense.AAC.2
MPRSLSFLTPMLTSVRGCTMYSSADIHQLSHNNGPVHVQRSSTEEKTACPSNDDGLKTYINSLTEIESSLSASQGR